MQKKIEGKIWCYKKCKIRFTVEGAFTSTISGEKDKILTGNINKVQKEIVNSPLATQRSQSRWYLALHSLSLSRSPLNLTDLQVQPWNKSNKWKHCCSPSTKTYGTEQQERVTALNRGNKLNGFPRSAERVSVLFSEKGTEFLSRSRQQRAVWKRSASFETLGEGEETLGKHLPAGETNAKHLPSNPLGLQHLAEREGWVILLSALPDSWDDKHMIFSLCQSK